MLFQEKSLFKDQKDPEKIR